MTQWNRLTRDILKEGQPVVLVTVIRHSGSAPRTSGARMLVRQNSAIQGTVGGGKYEAEAIKESVALLKEWIPGWQVDPLYPAYAKTLFVSLAGVDDADLICGGTLSLLLEILPPALLPLYRDAALAESLNQPLSFATAFLPVKQGERFAATAERLLEPGPLWLAHRHLVTGTERPGEDDVPTTVAQMAHAMKKQGISLIEDDGDVYLLEHFPAPSALYIFGGGHVAKALTEVLHLVGFQCIVVEDRAEFLLSTRFPHAMVECLPNLARNTVATFLSTQPVTPRHGIIIMTRAHAHDRDALAAALHTNAGYIGMIGSRKKAVEIKRFLLSEGADPQKIESVHTPIGLPIDAETPEEIAVSIAAELIAWKNRR